MESQRAEFRTIDEYIAGCPEEVRDILRAVRETIRAAAPDAEERISYRMPTFALHGNLVHFAALKRHIGFYPTASGVEAFKVEAGEYVSTKGALQFPLDQPMPLDLIARIVRFRVEENRARAAKPREKKPRENRSR